MPSVLKDELTTMLQEQALNPRLLGRLGASGRGSRMSIQRVRIMCRLPFVLFAIFGLTVSLVAAGCDPWQSITYDNQTSFRVKLDLMAVPLDYAGTPTLTWDGPGDVLNAGQAAKYSTPVRRSSKSRTIYKYTVVAVTETNEIVLAKVFTWDELREADWRVVISLQD